MASEKASSLSISKHFPCHADDLHRLLWLEQPVSKDEQEEGAHYIRHVLLKRLLFNGPSHVLWAVTGAMAPVCISFGDVRCDGGSLLQHCRQLSLPSVYGLPHMQLIWQWQVCAHWVGKTNTVNTISHPGRKATKTPICTLNRAMCRTPYFWKLRNQQVRYLEINKWHSECNVALSQPGAGQASSKAPRRALCWLRAHTCIPDRHGYNRLYSRLP